MPLIQEGSCILADFNEILMILEIFRLILHTYIYQINFIYAIELFTALSEYIQKWLRQVLVEWQITVWNVQTWEFFSHHNSLHILPLSIKISFLVFGKNLLKRYPLILFVIDYGIILYVICIVVSYSSIKHHIHSTK